MRGLPSPGGFVSAIGRGMQAAEDFVSNGVNNAIAAVENTIESVAPNAPQPVQVAGPNGTQATIQLANIVTQDQLNKALVAIHGGFDAVRSELASIRTHGPTGDGKNGFFDDEEDDSKGGGMDSNALMVLALSGSLTGGTATALDPTVLLLLAGGDGLGDLSPIELLMVLGKI